MYVMYVAPRFHTNQLDVIKGWIKREDKLKFVSYYKAPIEDYSDIEPLVLGFSPLYYIIDWFYMNVIKRNDPENTAFKINHGFPPLIKIFLLLKREKPDLVIMRDRTFYSMVVYLFCRIFNYDSILYNQSPLWDNPPKKDLMHRIVHKFTPKIRITPVIGFQEEGKRISANSHYVPFIQELRVAPSEKRYFRDNQIEIMMIGKFEPRKNHIMLANVIQKLSKIYAGLHLTIIGEASGRLQKEFLAKVEKHISDHHLEHLVSIYTNVSRTDIEEFYKKTDVFVMSSTREMASISQLEAMSYSIPVVISDRNGAAQYVEDGINGYWFHDCDEESLLEKMDLILSDKEKIKSMGKESYRLVQEKYQFKNYYEALMGAYKFESERT